MYRIRRPVFVHFFKQLHSFDNYVSFFFSSRKTFQLQDEAGLTLSCLDKCKDGGFEELFLTKIDYPAKYDYCMRYNFFI